MEIIIKDVNYNKCDFTCSINNKDITGITGKSKEALLDILTLNKELNGISIDNEIITKDNINKYRKKISIVKKDIKEELFLNTVEDNMKYIIKTKRLSIKDESKKMSDSLRIVGLNKTYISREINTLSKSELRLIGISISLLSNPDIILLDEPFIDLDNKNDKKLYRMLSKLREQYKKTIIICSNDSNTLYKYTDKMIFIKDNEVLIEGDTNNIYQDVDFLLENKIEVPDIVLFTYKANKKGIKLSYHKDIRDIIKDIYKHV